MTQRREFDYAGANGIPRIDSLEDVTNPYAFYVDDPNERRTKNWKLVLDPALQPASQKVFRVEGIIAGDPNPEPVIVHDPRSRNKRFWNKREAMELPVPKLKFDVNYVGTFLPREVTFTNLNDNINSDFLQKMCKSFGTIEEAKVYFHYKTKKHLGIGKVYFATSKAAKLCAEKLNNSSQMGMIIAAFVDSMGKERQKLVEAANQIGGGKAHSKNALPPEPRKNTSPIKPTHHPHKPHHHPHPLPHPVPPPRTPAYQPAPPEHLQHTPRVLPHSFPPPAEAGFTPVAPPLFSSTDQLPGDRRIPPLMSVAVPPPLGLDLEAGEIVDNGKSDHHRDKYRNNDHRHKRNHDDRLREDDRTHADRDYNRHRSRDRAHSSAERGERRRESSDEPRSRRDSRDDRRRHSSSRRRHRQSSSSTQDDAVRRDSTDDRTGKPETLAAEPQPPEEPHNMSLDSRIQSLLGAAFGSPDPDSSHYPPPLPPEPAPPLPREAPPLPSEPAPPPLPPEERGSRLDLDSRIALLTQDTHNDDDRMSMSSESDTGGDAIEVNPPQGMLPPVPPLPMWPMPGMPPPGQLVYQNHIYNQACLQQQGYPPDLLMMMGQGMMPFLETPVQVHEPEMDVEQIFSDVLDKVISELRSVLHKDVCKKIIETAAYETYERWWEREKERATSNVKPSTATAKVPDSTGSLSGITPTSSSTAFEKQALSIQPGSTLEALFENKDGGNFGLGGLLGLRGQLPKLPSFRKKFIKPPTPPPPEEEEEETSRPRDKHLNVRGPHTPEGSVNESDGDSDNSELESELAAIRERRKRRAAAIYSSDSSERSEEEDEDQDESEADDDQKTGKVTEEEPMEEDGSDVEVDDEHTFRRPTTPPLPSPVKTAVRSNRGRPPKAKKDKDARLVEAQIPGKAGGGSKQGIERATFPALEKDSLLFEEDGGSVEVEETSSLPDDPKLPTPEKKSPPATPPQQPAAGRDLSAVVEAESSVARKPRAREEAAALALLQMHQLSVEEKLRHEKQQQTAAAVRLEHAYSQTAGEPRRKAPAQPPGQEAEEEDSDATDSASEGEPDMIPCLPPSLTSDHQYCVLYHPIDYTERYRQQRERVLGKKFRPDDYFAEPVEVAVTDIASDIEIFTQQYIKKYVNRGRKAVPQVGELSKGSRELAKLLPPVEKPRPRFRGRTFQEQFGIIYEFMNRGIDQEDVIYLKRRYEELLQDDSPQTYWLNNIDWVDHTHTAIPDPPRKRRKLDDQLPVKTNKSGCARSEGYYKITHKEKKCYLKQAVGLNAYDSGVPLDALIQSIEKGRKQKMQQSREARSESRRIQSVLGHMGEDISDLLKFNQLKFRKKALRFAKSGIHDWGLFALETIAADEMVIEYVGQTIRASIADLREKTYEAMGIGSSYLFRIDTENIIDATKCGNLARFINHSCNPNCYAKIISVDGLKKIVIYSKVDIGINEEITYDYKFPIEEEKIMCLCSANGCRGTLN